MYVELLFDQFQFVNPLKCPTTGDDTIGQDKTNANNFIR
jgi:hypothetical protein